MSNPKRFPGELREISDDVRKRIERLKEAGRKNPKIVEDTVNHWLSSLKQEEETWPIKLPHEAPPQDSVQYERLVESPTRLMSIEIHGAELLQVQLGNIIIMCGHGLWLDPAIMLPDVPLKLFLRLNVQGDAVIGHLRVRVIKS